MLTLVDSSLFKSYILGSDVYCILVTLIMKFCVQLLLQLLQKNYKPLGIKIQLLYYFIPYWMI
jgi:hypothetical protein